MSKKFTAHIKVDDPVLLRDLDLIEVEDYIQRKLTGLISEAIVRDKTVYSLQKYKNNVTHGEIYEMSMITVNPIKYEQLKDILNILDLKYIDEDKTTIYLKDLL